MKINFTSKYYKINYIDFALITWGSMGVYAGLEHGFITLAVLGGLSIFTYLSRQRKRISKE